MCPRSKAAGAEPAPNPSLCPKSNQANGCRTRRGCWARHRGSVGTKFIAGTDMKPVAPNYPNCWLEKVLHSSKSQPMVLPSHATSMGFWRTIFAVLAYFPQSFSCILLLLLFLWGDLSDTSALSCTDRITTFSLKAATQNNVVFSLKDLQRTKVGRRYLPIT